MYNLIISGPRDNYSNILEKISASARFGGNPAQAGRLVNKPGEACENYIKPKDFNIFYLSNFALDLLGIFVDRRFFRQVAHISNSFSSNGLHCLNCLLDS